MKYKKYPTYKDSGVEWLGEIPEHWEMWKISHSFNSVGSGTTPLSNNESYYNGHIPWITTGELRENIINSTKKLLTNKALVENSSLKLFPIGSIAIAMYGATIGRLGKLGICATTNQACCVISNSKVISNNYLYYWLMGNNKAIINLAYGGGQPNISQDTILNLKISAPGLDEQQQIAKFLDNATQKMDTLIQKQKNLIRLLKEKRQAVISHAVTRGLNPDVKFKDSGVEWLGEVPEHWDVSLLKRYCKVTDGSHHSPSVQDEGLPFISVTDVGHNTIDFKNCKKILSKDFKQLVSEGCSPKTGDILLTKDGTIGRAAIVNERYPSFVILSSLGLLTPCSKMQNKYLYYYLISGINIDQMNSMIHGSALKRMTISKIDNLYISFPEYKEQEKIAEYLDDKISKIEALIKKATNSIKLLKEKRTALISAAVTGKIDVREYL